MPSVVTREQQHREREVITSARGGDLAVPRHQPEEQEKREHEVDRGGRDGGGGEDHAREVPLCEQIRAAEEVCAAWIAAAKKIQGTSAA